MKDSADDFSWLLIPFISAFPFSKANGSLYTAKMLSEKDGRYMVEAEVFGKGLTCG